MRRPPYEKRTSLARAAGPWTSAGVSALIVVCHLLFAYGQLVGRADDCPGFNNTHGCPADVAERPGSMMEVDLHADFAYRAKGPLAALAGALEEAACHSDCPAFGGWAEEGSAEGAASVCSMLSCDECSSVLGVLSAQHCTGQFELPVAHMSYFYAVTQLWGQDASPLCQRGDEPVCTHMYPGRPAAAALVLFSFVWPHLKLLLLHFFYYRPLSPSARRNGNCSCLKVASSFCEDVAP